MESPVVNVERTLCLIKPDIIEKADEVLHIIRKSGFYVVQSRRFHMTPEQASDFYAEHYGKMFFPSLIAYMSSGPVLALVLAKIDAISHWKQLVGPARRDQDPSSLRAIYGSDEQKNGLHASDSAGSAAREIKFIFPDMILEPLPNTTEATEYLQKNVNPVLLRGLTQLCKEKPADALEWLAAWLIDNNPNKPTTAHH
ncbi:nucleoside diphosphate kinase homolog 5-like [Dysidea avara]|uniref:nucleoside diphosphate kinase homolog 5-like n=1 Tax=Dysidea avara TaxID=196820 RepID=UPI003329B286